MEALSPASSRNHALSGEVLVDRPHLQVLVLLDVVPRLAVAVAVPHDIRAASEAEEVPGGSTDSHTDGDDDLYQKERQESGFVGGPARGLSRSWFWLELAYRDGSCRHGMERIQLSGPSLMGCVP